MEIPQVALRSLRDDRLCRSYNFKRNGNENDWSQGSSHRAIPTDCAAAFGRRAASPVATRIRPFAATLLGFLLLAGCPSAHVSEPLAAKYGANDADSQLEFWHR